MENGPWELFYVRLRKIKLVFSSKNESRDDKIEAKISLVAKKMCLNLKINWIIILEIENFFLDLESLKKQ